MAGKISPHEWHPTSSVRFHGFSKAQRFPSVEADRPFEAGLKLLPIALRVFVFDVSDLGVRAGTDVTA